MSQRPQTERYKYLDGLRGFASLLVVIHHGFTLVDFAIFSGNPADSHFSWDVWLSAMPFVLINSGSFAVCIFFALSGFVLAESFSKTKLSLAALAAKRYVRLSVLILIANLFAFCVFAALTSETLPGAPSPGRSFTDVGLALAYCIYEALFKATIHGLSGASYNGVLWTMYIEFWGSMLLILVFVLARLVGSKVGPKQWYAGAFSLVGAALVLTWNSYLMLFGVGAALNLLVRSRGRAAWWPTWAVFIGMMIALVLGTMPLGRSHPLFYDPLLFLFGGTFESMAALSIYQPLLSMLGVAAVVPAPLGPFVFWHAVGAICLVAVLCRSRGLQSLLSRPLFQWLGHISFPLYLVHPTVRETLERGLLLQGLKHGLSYGAASTIALVIYVAVAVVIAHFFALAFEHRATRWASSAGLWVERKTSWSTGMAAVRS